MSFLKSIFSFSVACPAALSTDIPQRETKLVYSFQQTFIVKEGLHPSDPSFVVNQMSIADETVVHFHQSSEVISPTKRVIRVRVKGFWYVSLQTFHNRRFEYFKVPFFDDGQMYNLYFW